MTISRTPLSTPAVEAHAARLRSRSRLDALRATGLLDGTSNPVLERIARLASRLIGAPVALVSLVDDVGQYFPGMTGLDGWPAEVRGTPMAYSFCQYVVTSRKPLIVNDAAQHTFLSTSPTHTELGIVAYAGVPLRTSGQETIGALCALDRKAVQWTDEQIETLEELAAAAMAELELRAASSALLRSADQLRTQALHDPITGLFSRQGFLELANATLTQAQGSAQPLVLAMLDIDQFRRYNRRLGQKAGDTALKAVAQVLQDNCRPVDLVSRTGSDEFVALMPDTTHAAGVAWGERVQRSIRALGMPGISISLGVTAWAPGSPVSIDQLLVEADDQRLLVKANGTTRSHATN